MAAEVLRSINENPNADIEAVINSGGGDVFAGWTMIGAINGYKGKTSAKVGGAAMSMAAMMLLYFDNVEALDVSNIMLHRADMYVSSPEDQAFLDKVNLDMRKQMEAKIDGKMLKQLKGVSIKDMFENPNRIDVFLTAEEAKKIGLVNKVIKLKPRQMEAYQGMFLNAFLDAPEPPATEPVAAKPAVTEPAATEPVVTEPISNPNPSNTMTIDELKAKHPDVYAAAVNTGVEQERDRVQAIMVYADADLAAVKAAIDGGKPLTAKQTQEFLVKMTSGQQLAAVATDGGKPAPVTQAPAADDKRKQAEADMLASVNLSRKHLGLAAFTELPEAYKAKVVVQ